MKNLLRKQRASGFTIIEVMIVLAIAGLIMVIVFIAVPQLQRNQRDNARQNIANRIKAEMETYAGNNQGTYPFKPSCTATGCWNDFMNRYIDGKVKVLDPTLAVDVIDDGTNGDKGSPTALAAANCEAIQGTGGANITKGQVHICKGAKCDGENIQATTGGATTDDTRVYAIVIGLDRDGTSYCVDNG